jgi:erythromycin esterase-like protein
VIERDAAVLAKERDLARAIAASAYPLTGGAEDFDPLLDLVGDARFVLLGEATHGTHEFYAVRAAITKRLVREKGFVVVAVEGDWPDCWRVNRYVKTRPGADSESIDALADFERFPTWMWRNADVLDFVGWLRAHNDERAGDTAVGFYGLDLYSLRASSAAVLRYLEGIDPPAAERARERYACFDRFGEDPQSYGYATKLGIAEDCRDEVVRQLVELQRSRAELLSRDGRIAEDEFFFAEQNAAVVKNAETYYRTMFEGRVSSWNVRDRHMAQTLEKLATHLDRRLERSKVVVWAHNSHVGDARATNMGDVGELNIGQLVRERWRDDAVLVGFTTFSGTVTAASDWDEPAERKRVRPALAGSCERLFHEVGVPKFLLPLRGSPPPGMDERRLERAIGVVYRPGTERQSHYVAARLANQFDAILHYDETRAVEPLERSPRWEHGETPETYPTGL